MDHDRMFKQLLHTFFAEFLDLFLPEVAAYVDRGSIEFLDKELFTDLAGGDRHEVDVLAKARFRDRPAFFLLHVENQASAMREFARRIFLYFARLTEKFGLPVYPIALLSYDRPRRAEPDRYRVQFPDRRVLDFQFRVIQLNRMRWQDFLGTDNPVASALMTKMQIAPADRPRVKLECIRLMARLGMDEARQMLIWDFLESYLGLSDLEEVRLQRQTGGLKTPEKEKVMAVLSAGDRPGASNIILLQLRHRFGEVPERLRARIRELDHLKIEAMGQLMFDFKDLAEVKVWVAANWKPIKTRR